MILKEELFEIGKINKPHGISGELSFTFSTDVFDQEGCEFIVLEIDGIFVPFFIDSYRFKTDTTGLIKLEGIENEVQARKLSNMPIYLPVRYAQEIEPEELGIRYFIGFEIIDTTIGSLGRIEDIEDSTDNVLFIVVHGGQELLIPATDDFIENIDEKKRIIYMRLPEGLIDLDNTETV